MVNIISLISVAESWHAYCYCTGQIKITGPYEAGTQYLGIAQRWIDRYAWRARGLLTCFATMVLSAAYHIWFLLLERWLACLVLMEKYPEQLKPACKPQHYTGPGGTG